MQSDRGSSPTSRTAIHVGTPHQSPPPCKLKKQPPSCDDFGVAFICALPIEAAAIIALFDEQWDYGALDKADTDTNQYSLGSIAECCVVLAHMPGMGKVAAATVAGNLRSSFRYLKLILVVGICGGVPKAPSKAWDELLLGDVVVSTGLVQYDFGRQLPNRFVRKDTVEDNLSRLSVEAGCILAKLRTEQAREGLCRSMSRHLGTIQNRLGAKVAYPGRSNDMLFRSDYLHKHHKVGQCSVCAGDVAAVCDQAFERSCEELGCGHLPSDLIPRLRPEHELDPVVHFGLFGSGDTVMRSGTDRDEIADRNGILAFEMEGAGLWEMLRVSSCLIVKSVCDYSDSHKNKSFQGYAAAVAAATAKALLQCWTACMPKSLQARHPSRRPPRNRRPPLTAGEIRVLNRLKTLPYSDRKDRNPRRVPGTCEWFVRHKLFRGWLEGVDSQSSALWASADPGCGKSVLARYLVDNVLPTSETRTTCYFFFKDDFEDQKSVVDALKCILHQLFTQKPVLFSDAIRAQIEAEEDKLALSFRDLWDILLRAADTEDAGEVLCIFDALDECGLEDRSKLTAALIDLRHTKKAPNLKFLLTSRPYGTIRRSFQLPDAPDLAVIHLSGEDEAEIEQISREIDIFIKARVQGIGARLMLGEERQELLLRSLLNVPHRTYLWVYLTLSLVESDENITKGKIRQTTSLLPRSVDEAYEKILSASRDPDEARRALHIIVAAKTPLTLGEMNFALTLRSSHRSYHDVDLTSDGWFRERLRDICGLFVTVINSKIYLLHQTAKEFLVKPDREEERILKLRWKHSLDPSESHRILGEICLWNLQFPELHKHMDIGFWDIRDCVRHYQFLEYSTVAWASHLLAQDVKIDKLLIEAILDLYRRCDRHCPFWFQLIAAEAPANTVYGVTLPTIADDPDRTLLMIASFFGLAPVVEALIKTGGGGGLLARDSQGRTALTWAVMYGHHDAARILIESQPGVLRGLSWLGLWKPAIVEAANNKGETPLIHAVLGVSESLTRLLLDKGANIEARDVRGATALWHAAGEVNCAAVVKLLLDKGADTEAKDNELEETPLYKACRYPAADVPALLLQKGANVDSRNGSDDQTPLMTAIEYGRAATTQLLLDHGANIQPKTKKGHSAFSLACSEGNLDVIKLFLQRGTDVESKDTSVGMSALAEAARCGRHAVAQVLLDYGADLESKDVEGRTPLAWAAFSGHCDKTVLVLLQAGANVNSRGRDGRNALHRTVLNQGNRKIVELLLEHGADLEHKDNSGRTAVSYAAGRRWDPSLVELLLKRGAEVNAKDNRGRTPLFWATDRGVSPSHAKILIQHGADVNARDKEGKTPLALACGETGNPLTAQFLREMCI